MWAELCDWYACSLICSSFVHLRPPTTMTHDSKECQERARFLGLLTKPRQNSTYQKRFERSLSYKYYNISCPSVEEWKSISQTLCIWVLSGGGLKGLWGPRWQTRFLNLRWQRGARESHTLRDAADPSPSQRNPRSRGVKQLQQVIHKLEQATERHREGLIFHVTLLSAHICPIKTGFTYAILGF